MYNYFGNKLYSTAQKWIANETLFLGNCKTVFPVLIIIWIMSLQTLYPGQQKISLTELANHYLTESDSLSRKQYFMTSLSKVSI